MAISSAMTDDDILAEHIQDNFENQDDDADDDNDQPPQSISFKQARSHIAELSYFLSARDIDDSVFSALVYIENVMDRARVDQLNQSKITDYFNTS